MPDLLFLTCSCIYKPIIYKQNRHWLYVIYKLFPCFKKARIQIFSTLRLNNWFFHVQDLCYIFKEHQMDRQIQCSYSVLEIKIMVSLNCSPMWKYESVKFITCSSVSLLTEESDGGPFSFEIHLQIVWHSNK